MDLLLESPVEALLFRYSAAIAGYLWTCLALFAAGIGVWRFRLLGAASRSASVSNSPPPVVSPAIPTPSPASTQIAPAMVMAECGSREESRSSTKGRFTAYYTVEEDEIGGEEIGAECDGGINGVDQGFDLFCWGRRGDLGWYSNQDRTAINGSVVRLWDDCRSVAAVARPPAYGFCWGGLGVCLGK